MPADWNKPVLTSPYADVLDFLAEKDVDAVSLFETDGSNIPETAMKYARATNKFQERLAGAWVDKVISIAGGGTGGATAANARTNLGLGTISIQDANNVLITGGTIAGIATLGVTTITATTVNATTLTGAGSGITALNASNLASGTVPDARFPATLPALSGINLTALNGSNIASGTVAAARLGSGSSITTKFLRGDNTWQEVSVAPVVQHITVTLPATDASIEVSISAVADITKAYIIPRSGFDRSYVVGAAVNFRQVRVYFSNGAGGQVTTGASSNIIVFDPLANSDSPEGIYAFDIVSWN